MTVTAPNLCARVNFKAARVVRNGVGYLGFVSAHRTQVNNAGGCKRICADLVLDPGRGVLGLMIRSEGRLCFGGFANVGGYVTGALRGILAGHIVLFSTIGDCKVNKFNRDLECRRAPLGDKPWQCFAEPDEGGHDCLHCIEPSGQPLWSVLCTILQDVTDYPCVATGAIPGGAGMVMPSGMTVIPDEDGWDIYGDREPFSANNGRLGLVKYVLQPRWGAVVDPVWLSTQYPQYCNECPNWLCYWVDHYLSGAAWMLHCTHVQPDPDLAETKQACCVPPSVWPQWECYGDYTPSQCRAMGGFPWGPGTTCETAVCGDPIPGIRACCLPDGQCLDLSEADCVASGGYVYPYPGYCHDVQNECAGNNEAWMFRRMELYPQEPIGFVRFNIGHTHQPCFQLIDNYCFTSGPDTDHCGGSPCWSHLQRSQTPLPQLDHITVDCDMRLAEGGDDYPHAEPEYVEICNRALAMVGEHITSVNHGRENSFDHAGLNRWSAEILYNCSQAPVVWPVTVRPYQTSCEFPAELVITRMILNLWLSGQPGDLGWYGNDDYWAKVRVLAVLTCHVYLDVRLLPGWQSIECPVSVTNDPGSPCGPILSDPDRYMIVAGQSCTRVPRRVQWKGILGPAPWSSGESQFEGRSREGGMCCDFMCAIDELLIPGEINRTEDLDAAQRYAGDVILFANTDGCGGCDPRGT